MVSRLPETSFQCRFRGREATISCEELSQMWGGYQPHHLGQIELPPIFQVMPHMAPSLKDRVSRLQFTMDQIEEARNTLAKRVGIVLLKIAILVALVATPLSVTPTLGGVLLSLLIFVIGASHLDGEGDRLSDEIQSQRVGNYYWCYSLNRWDRAFPPAFRYVFSPIFALIHCFVTPPLFWGDIERRERAGIVSQVASIKQAFLDGLDYLEKFDLTEENPQGKFDEFAGYLETAIRYAEGLKSPNEVGSLRHYFSGEGNLLELVKLRGVMEKLWRFYQRTFNPQDQTDEKESA